MIAVARASPHTGAAMITTESALTVPVSAASLPANPRNHDSPEQPKLATDLLFALSGGVLLLHGLLSGRYGYFRDELYFLDCARHLAWGYVDMAPMIALV